ncbi:MAG TPA: hypothetical protein VMM18_16250 [Gemmatimonadaceae bacterium]|nr:hypothetical protein [Gemmatimonadaceae bacterium]
MERNPNENLDSQNRGQTGDPPGSSGTSGGYGTGASGAAMSGSGVGGTAGTQHEGVGERARETLEGAKEKARSGMHDAREKAGHLKDSLADKLDSGAERLRQRGRRNIAGEGGDGSAVMHQEERLDHLTDGLASGMHNTAEWLRENDLESLKQGVEQQVRDHPGRTLLIALGLGYIIGKAVRR